MRLIPLVLLIATLAACEFLPGSGPHPVDPATLAPLSSQEQALLATGDAAVARGDYVNAEKNYLDAVAQSQGHVEAHVALAQMYLKIGDTAKVRPMLERALAYQPNHPRANYLMGKLALQADEPSGALHRFERGLSGKPGDYDLLNGRGVAYDMLRRHVEAQGAYLNAINLNPSADPAMARTNLSMSYLLDNKPEKAAQLLKAEARKPGASAVTRHNLALAYGMLGRHTEARKLIGDDMTEDQRKASLKRLAQYIAQRDATGKAIPTPVPPTLIKEAK